MSVKVYFLGEKQQYGEAAREALASLESLDIELNPYHQEVELDEGGVIVDALLGIGLKSDVKGAYHQAIDAINQAEQFVLSIDVPSGIDADTGSVKGCAVKADMTVTFIGIKQGLVTSDALDHTGDLICDELGLDDYLEKHAINALLLDEADIFERLPSRRINAHKGELGHVLVIGGDKGMAGACRMAAEAALRVGAGKVTAFTHLVHHPIMLQGRSELMCLPFEDPSRLKEFFEQTTAIVVGPGLSESTWSNDVIVEALAYDGPKVIDAGALTYLSKHPQAISHAILTPHPGEAAKLLGVDNSTISQNRYEAVVKLVEKYQLPVLLKGAGSVIQTLNDIPYVCRLGNPAMASAGMGDVLAGMIAGFIAQGVGLDDALVLATTLHAFAGDLAVKDKGIYGLLATDLYDYFHQAMVASDNIEIEADEFLL